MNFNFNNFATNSQGNNSNRGGQSYRGNQTLNLKKNDILDLSKVAPSLKNVVLGAGWQIARTGPSFDLDISAFLLNNRGVVERVPDDVIFFNHQAAPGIHSEGDNLVGGSGSTDDERIDISLDKLDQRIQKIVFIVTIFEADIKRQTFGMVNNSYVRLLDQDNGDKEICRFDLKDKFSTETGVVFAELSKDARNNWSFRAIGEGFIGDLNTIIQRYI